MWVLDYLDEIESDFSVFHRVDDPMALGSPRYFRLARLLGRYDGALRCALDLERAPLDSSASGEDASLRPRELVATTGGREELPDITSIVAMSQNAGFPSIAYTSGE